MKYYVYHLIDERNNKVFYVGKGCHNRMYKHVDSVKKGKIFKNTKLYNKINKILKENKKILYEKVFETDIEQEAFNYEIYEIKRIGKENLCNLTDGGDGFLRLYRTKEHKNNISKALKGKPKSKEHCEKLKLIKLQNPVKYWKNKKFSEDHKNKLKIKAKNRYISDERRKQMGNNFRNHIKKIKGKTFEEIFGIDKAKELRYKSGNGNRGRKFSKEERIKRSKKYIAISPTNETYKIDNLVDFCKEHNFSTIIYTYAKNNKTYKGWKIQKQFLK